MKALLVDVDSRIANLALMKLSTFHKSRGNTVALHLHRSGRGFKREVPTDADKAYVSSLFTWNLEETKRILAALVAAGVEVEVGGTGIDHGRQPQDRILLPPWIEGLAPDYDLYGADYAVGFCNRGCTRSCTFCDVPLKEGKIRTDRYRPPWTWVPDGFRKALLLDNDIALYENPQLFEILGWFRDSGVKCSITQGWDLRCTTPERAALLAELKPWDYRFTDRILYTAWDYPGIEPFVRRGLRMLIDAGMRPRDIRVYMIVGHDPRTRGPTPVGDPNERASALHRFRVLWEEFGTYPFVMKFNNRKDDPWLNAFARWGNRPALFKSFPFEEYRRRGTT